MSKTIMLIHGAWLNARCWDGFRKHYEARGYTVIAPDWPLDDREPRALRDQPDPALAKVGQKRIVEHYERLIQSLPEAPILIGHSLGGVFVQHLLDRGHGAAGVAIDPAPTPGVPLGPHAIVSAWPVLSDPFSGGKLMHMSRTFFRTRFAQTLPLHESDAMYDRYIVPTPGKVYWDGILKAAGAITWSSRTRAPLLLIGGGKDLIADASMTRAIFEKQKRAASRTELKIFEDRSHWTCLDRGWEAVADYALDWAAANAHSRLTRPLAAA
ncbi:alpha/beta hydrolase [Phenylobacterium deserti]|uniref:Alpha/beta hydrolase n=1 Tax=Phenylobacterium deserti TaxID=1914756 RepID=A0A328ADJ0_9CAUL|nr:alpha/beta hydrolase [Phenylobacterium deserti]RAK52710.1 alpha/beta hydrolase [Phenylobacterium deserti]